MRIIGIAFRPPSAIERSGGESSPMDKWRGVTAQATLIGWAVKNEVLQAQP
jgi:hypothetical protein